MSIWKAEKSESNSSIDFIITWVDGNDVNWITEKEKYTVDDLSNKQVYQYRNWENLQYWFRGIEKYTPWVNKIHFVTYGHIPKWLKIDHPKINVVKHVEFIPGEFLPTFSSHPIELYLHRIKGLSEQFVYFNDDMFVIDEMKPSDFFNNGLPCDTGVFNAITAIKDGFSNIIFNNMGIINKYFKGSEQSLRNRKKHLNIKYGLHNLRTILLSPWKSYIGFHDPHLPISFLKTTFLEIWIREKEFLNEISKNKFRTPNDVNVWLFRYWQLASGEFSPRKISLGKYFEISYDNSQIVRTLKKQKCKMICINDADIRDFDNQKRYINEAFEDIFPNKSTFEL